MSFWLGVVVFILAVEIVVIVHESGHFFFAKAFGMKVQEFFVGFGPRLWSFHRGETEYGVKAIPAGGYVRIAGMNPFQEEPPEDVPRTFGAKPVWQRFVVILAGPVTHFLMAFLFLAVYFSAIGAPSLSKAQVASVQAELNGAPSPAAAAGLKPGDLVLSVDGRPVHSLDQLVAYTRTHVGQPVRLTVARDGKVLTLVATPVLSDVGGQKVGRLGVDLQPGRERTNPLVAVGRAGIMTARLTGETVRSLGQVFGPAGLDRIGRLLAGSTPRRPTDVGSVVSGARLAGQAAQSGNWDFFFGILIILNVFVGLVNLVPLPPLDGGHLAALAYEKIRRRRPDIRKLVPLTTVVAAFLILFSLSLIYIDITKPIPNPFR